MNKVHILFDHGRFYSSDWPYYVMPTMGQMNRRGLEQLTKRARVYVLRVSEDGELEVETLERVPDEDEGEA